MPSTESSVPAAATAAPPIVRLENVSKTFVMGEVAVEALRNISCEIHDGELLTILGPSGSGKTTALNLIGGLDTVTSGKVYFRQSDITAFTPTRLTSYRREAVGFVFQFYNLVANLTALENVLVATEISEHPMEPAEALDLVGLVDRMDHFPAQLSGGEQQRVAIARALAKNPELLLCDEPTGALDYGTGLRILRLLTDLKDRLGKAVVVVTHNAAIGDASDRVIRMRSGEIVETRVNEHPLPPEEIAW